MPLVRISYKTPRSSDFPRNLSDCVHRAIVESLKVPDGDRFQVLTEHSEGLVYDPQFLGIERTDGMTDLEVVVQEILQDKIAIDYPASGLIAPKV